MTMNRTEARYDLDMIVTWGDCDAAGISYYAKNFDWFTNGRMRLLESYGLPYMSAFFHQGISLVCLTADCQYKKMLRPEERVTLSTWISSLTRSRMAFSYQLYKEGGVLAAEGMTTHAYVDEHGQPVNLEKRHPELWNQLTETHRQRSEQVRESGGSPHA